VRNQNKETKGNFLRFVSEILFQIFGWATLILLASGIVYTLFFSTETPSTPLDPATYKRLNDAYQRRELQETYREGDPYRGSAY